jgi:citrate synthase
MASQVTRRDGTEAGEDVLEVVDRRTGRRYELPVRDGAISALDLRQIKVSEDDFGLVSYDPGFVNTASCRSGVTYLDGEGGVLRYRGYPIEQLAERASYLEVAYLILRGELPTAGELEEWRRSIALHTMVHENTKELMQGFRYDAHPMGILLATVAALSTFYPDAKAVKEPESRRLQIRRLIAKIPTVAAFAYRHSAGLPYIYPDNSFSYTGNFLQMMFRPAAERNYAANAVLERALDVLFILHADHEQNCSTSAMRGVGSSQADPFTAAASAIGALYGPLHGGANEQVLRMLKQIGSKDRVPGFIEDVKRSRGDVRLMGFGHRVYKNYDPRARIIKKLADEVFEVTGKNPLLEIALELERIALEDEYFLKRKLYPNVDFYSGLIYQALGFPTDMFPVLFAIGRMSGWLAQWEEMLQDPDQRIARPRQLYAGLPERQFVPIEER